MDVSAEAADLVVKEGLQATETAVKLAGSGIKNVAALLLALSKQDYKVIGQASAARLARDGYRIVEVGKGPNLAGVAEYRKTTFPELCALISSAAAFVGHDSAPFHVAQAYGVPAAAAFGAILPELRDHSGKVFPIQADSLNCLGCHHYQRAPRTAQTCLRKRPLCMDLISAEMVERQARAALKSREA